MGQDARGAADFGELLGQLPQVVFAEILTQVIGDHVQLLHGGYFYSGYAALTPRVISSGVCWVGL